MLISSTFLFPGFAEQGGKVFLSPCSMEKAHTTCGAGLSQCHQRRYPNCHLVISGSMPICSLSFLRHFLLAFFGPAALVSLTAYFPAPSFVSVVLLLEPPVVPGECLPGAHPARYFSINYPNFSP